MGGALQDMEAETAKLSKDLVKVRVLLLFVWHA